MVKIYSFTKDSKLMAQYERDAISRRIEPIDKPIASTIPTPPETQEEEMRETEEAQKTKKKARKKKAQEDI